MKMLHRAGGVYECGMERYGQDGRAERVVITSDVGSCYDGTLLWDARRWFSGCIEDLHLANAFCCWPSCANTAD